MKKIDYHTIENKYLKKIIKSNLGDKENEWKNLIKDNNYLKYFLDNNVKAEDIISAPYEKIVIYRENYRSTSLYKDYKKYCKGLKSSKSKLEEKDEIKKDYEKQIDTYEKLKEIFDYDKYSQVIRNFFIENSEKLNINTCHYCDTAYTGFFEKSDGDKKGQFELDHFFPKDKYPFLALSLYNFVPSCSWCNRLKSDEDWENIKGLEKISPASDKYNFDNNVKIRVEPKLIDENEGLFYYGDNFAKNPNLYKVVFDFDEENKYDTLIKILHLKERYNMKSIKSVALNLLDLKKKYPSGHISEMAEIFAQNDIYVSEDEIRRFIFNGNQDKKYSLLNKLRRDILDWEPELFDSKDS